MKKVCFLFAIFFGVSCTQISLSLSVPSYTAVEIDEPWHPIPIGPEEYSLAVETIQRRAHQISEVKWHTLGAVPKNERFFPKNMTVSGIPYSSVKELDKFVGHEVSFYTFLTAAKNPKSVLYTENVGLYPYNGENCATFYGTVCSMTVNYALGLNAPFDTSMYELLPFIERVSEQTPTSIKIGDILWKKGHVVLVEDIVYAGDGTIEKVFILESIGSYARIKDYTFQDFVARWESSSWVLYRYLDFGRVLLQEDIAFLSSTSIDNYSVDFDPQICTSRGDRACYREGDDILINILSSYDGTVSILKDGVVCFTRNSDEKDFILSNLAPGQYSVELTDAIDKPSTCFEIIETKVDVQRTDDGVIVKFGSLNGYPENVVLCTSTGGRTRIHILTASERDSGSVRLRTRVGCDYLKVFFRGEYGRVSNAPIRLV